MSGLLLIVKTIHIFLLLLLLCVKVRARKYHNPGGVCWRGGSEPLFCTRPVAGGKHHELAGQPGNQSKPNGWGSAVPLNWPVEQQHRRRQGQRRRPAVGRCASVLQPVGSAQWRGRTRDWEPHPY